MEQKTRPQYVVKHIKSDKFISTEIHTDENVQCPKLTNDLQAAEVVNSSFLNNLLGTCNLYDEETQSVIGLCERNDFEVWEVKVTIFDYHFAKIPQIEKL